MVNDVHKTFDFNFDSLQITLQDVEERKEGNVFGEIIQ